MVTRMGIGRRSPLAAVKKCRERCWKKDWVLGKQSGGAPVDHAVWGGIQGLADRASRMASMGRRPWLRALTR